jgi:hypothetical protein
VGAAAVCLTRWQRQGLTRAAGRRRGERKAVTRPCSKATAGSGGREGGDEVLQLKEETGEVRDHQVELTVEGKNGGG